MIELTEYHKLRPRQLLKRRLEFPVAYIGLGILEWHGLHNPLGLDGVKANGVACYLAEQLGGVVMPPQFWGDDRRELAELVFDPEISTWLPEGTIDSTISIANAMMLEKEDFQRDALRSAEYGGWVLWEKLMVRTFFEIETLGFKVIVAIPGHYPLFAPLDRAIAKYIEEEGRCSVVSLRDTMYSESGDAGDHAAKFETSLLLALYPELVDLNELEQDFSLPDIGILGDDPRIFASKEFGEEILAKFKSIVVEYLAANSITGYNEATKHSPPL